MKTAKKTLINPLVAFYEEGTLSWREIANETGLNVSQVHRLASKEGAEEVLRCQLRNIFIIEDTLKIDFMTYARAMFGGSKKTKKTAK